MLPYYYGTQEQMSQKEAYHFMKYRKQTPFTQIGNVLIDRNVYTPMNLDCWNCRKVHPTTCCEDGQPYSTTKEAEERFAQHAPNIIRQYLNPECQAEAKARGYTETFNERGRVQVIKKCQNGDCFFYSRHNEEAFCTIHRYAEEQQLSPLHLKPYSCMLFPLDIIQVNQYFYLTAITKETAIFSRWGDTYDSYLCVDIEAKKEHHSHSPYFDLNQYRPAWEWNRELLEDSFGQELIQLLEKVGVQEKG